MNTSPFTLNRFEYEQTHLYHLPEPVFSILQQTKSVFLLGSRGTGKTTLLQALSWQEQTGNAVLIEKLGNTFKDRRYMGIYLRVPLYQAALFKAWPAGDETLRAAVFSAYTDLIWVQAACEGLASLLANRIVRASTSREYDLTDQLLQDHPELLSGSHYKRPLSLIQLGRLIQARRRDLEKLALSASDISATDLNALFPLAQIGALGRSAAERIAQFLARSYADDQPWQLKVCLDEAECLDPFQQRVLNTAVRLTNARLAYVISYVRPMEDMTGTLLPNISLQRADREVLVLDEMDDGAFLRLAEGVSQVRIVYQCGSEAATFRSGTTLGELDINALLYTILQTSEKPEARRLLDGAEQLRHAYQEVNGPENAESIEKYPPIYQAYLIERLKLSFPSSKTPKERRAQESAEIRKRMVAAYLCLCSELDKQVRYAYADMLLQMSDKCIRDYLLQMDEVFRESGRALHEFLEGPIGIDIQDRALRRAGARKREYVPASGVGSPTEALRIIDALGNLTARLQTTKYQQRGLRSSERGIFVVDVTRHSEDLARTLRLVTDAADAGFFKILKQSADEWHFRVHCSLAAAYGFSYRGAYYPVALRASDLSALYSEADSDRREELLRQLESWVGSDESGDLPLLRGLEE